MAARRLKTNGAGIRAMKAPQHISWLTMRHLYPPPALTAARLRYAAAAAFALPRRLRRACRRA